MVRKSIYFLICCFFVSKAYALNTENDINHFLFTALDFELFGDYFDEPNIDDNGTYTHVTDQNYTDFVNNTFPTFPSGYEVNGFPFIGGGGSGGNTGGTDGSGGTNNEVNSTALNQLGDDMLANGLNNQNAQDFIDNGGNLIADQMNPDGQEQQLGFFTTDAQGNVIPADGQGGFQTEIGVAQTGQGDQDNDVPTLLSIRAKMEALEKETRGFKKKVSNPVFNSDSNQTDYEIESLDSEVTLSDIHQELQKLLLQTESSIQNQLTHNDEQNETISTFVSELNSSIQQHTDEIQTKLDELEAAFVSVPTIEEPNTDFTSYYITLPSALSQKVGVSTIDLFNIKIGDLELPTLADISLFVSLIISITAVMIYIIKTKSLIMETMRDLTLAQESNPVTNYSAFGWSAGALAVKSMQFSIISVGIIGLLGLCVVTLSETIGFGAFSGDPSSIPMQIISSIEGIGNFAQIAVFWFFKFVPIISIISMISFYFIQVFAIRSFLLILNRGARLAS